MLKWGSKMRPPFLNDFGMEYHTTGQPTRESKASQIPQIPQIPMFRALLKTRPFLPCGRRRISVPCPDDPCPDLVDPCRAAQEGFQKYGALFSGKKKRLRQRTHKPRASRNMGPFFLEKKKKRLRQRTHKLRASRNLAPLGFRPKNKVFERPG